MAASAWAPILPTDFVDALGVPNTDPNGIFTSLTHIGAGRYQAAFTTPAVDCLPLTQMATWRLNPPSGFNGSGYFTWTLRITPTVIAATRYAAPVVGICDSGGDPTAAGAKGVAGGMVSNNPPANGWFAFTNSTLAGGSFSSGTLQANGPVYYTYQLTFGGVGLPTTVGARGGAGFPPEVYWTSCRGYSAAAGTWETGDGDAITTTPLNGGLYPIFGVGANNGGGAEVLDFTMEWSVFERWPAGTFGTGYDAP